MSVAFLVGLYIVGCEVGTEKYSDESTAKLLCLMELCCYLSLNIYLIKY